MLVIAVAGIMLAVWSFVDAFSNVARVRDPGRVLALRPNDPLALAYAADRAILEHPDDPAVRNDSIRAARQALGRTLLNPTAVRIVALGFEGTPKRLLAALGAAQSLTRHDMGTQLMLIEVEVEQKDIPGALRSYDRILRRKPVMGDTLFPILAGAARDPAIGPSLSARLATGTPWSGYFIDWALANDRELGSLLPVLEAARPDGTGLNQGRKQAIVKRLVELADYPSAFAAYRRYRTDTKADRSDFTSQSTFPPFDWEIQNGSGIDGSIDVAAGRFRFTMMGDQHGLLLRRLVAVEPGTHRLQLTGAMSGAQTASLSALLECVSTNNALAKITLKPGEPAAAVDLTIPPAACDFVWLTLEGTTTGNEPAEGNLSRLHLSPLRTRSFSPVSGPNLRQDRP